ncbi:helix-turn-helix domain-containing protein [Tenacibaculum sp. MAR_2009_124]|uniref:helix-turn-helix domain-containing protein n=1 Tax=Tenacibaculum sp. MAR_2009_124 TaxID=1250059 RepID=UPI000B85D313|nr:helix-turn-helix domain-containing protein [Tenacibaculum sp. MAR_2009_124]
MPNKEYFEVKDSYSLSIIRSELHILITKLFRLKYKNHHTFFDRKYLNDFIEFQKLVETNVTKLSKVIDYANLMNVSTKTLNNISQSVLNVSAKTFIDDVYITQIKRLLLNSNETIKEIAYLSGFEETPNFYKYFKRHTNTTPELFRRQNT